MTATAIGVINDRWELQLTRDRVEFHAVRPLWEAGRLAHMCERVDGMVIYDCGAESGDFTALYKLWAGVQGDVVPIEPSLPYWPSIRETWQANNTAPPAAWWPGFVGSDTTTHEHGTLLRREGWPERTWPRSAAGEIAPDFGFRHLAQQTATTPQVRIDALADLTSSPPDALVIDVEGAEWHVLAGMSELARMPLVWVSVHEPTMLDWYQRTIGDIHDLMRRFGYRDGVELPWHGEGETFWFFES